MNAAVLGAIGLILFVLAYRFYSQYLAKKIFSLQNELDTEIPSQKYQDGVDYVPTRPGVLFGHHYSSIAGAAPIVGPAVAVIWGWLPAFLWIVCGVIFLGASHDFGALVVSLKHKGNSIGNLTEKILGKRSRTFFMWVIFFLIWMVIAVFSLVIANLFIKFPSSVIPVNFEIIIAIIIGLFIHKKGTNLLIPSLMAQVGLLVMIYIGTQYPISLSFLFGEQEVLGWIFILLFYNTIVSLLPVWVLLQPRDYINSHQLFLGLGLMITGLMVTAPTIVAPAINPHPEGAPPWFPFLFITIACGAISGFHGLVSSGTSSKQIKRWKDARTIGYGGMIGEGVLALLATLAVSCGFKTQAAWHHHYASWDAANGLAAKIKAFVLGSGKFLVGLGIPESFSQTVIAVLIISFAATSLDTAFRIQRYILAEMGGHYNISFMKNRFGGSFLTLATSLLLILMKSGGQGGLFLWPLFGATNQMLAGLTLLVISVFLLKGNKNALPYLIPALMILLITTLGLIFNLRFYFLKEQWPLFVLGFILLIAQTGIFFEGIQVILKNYKLKKDPNYV